MKTTDSFNSHRSVWEAKRLPSSKWKHCKRKWMCFLHVQECTSKADWGGVIGPCKSNRLWRLLVSIVFNCPGYLSLHMFWESGYRHSSAAITPPRVPGKTALFTSLQTEHPLHSTHWVTQHLSGSGRLPPIQASMLSQAGLPAAPGWSAGVANPPWATTLPLLLIAAHVQLLLYRQDSMELSSVVRAGCVISAKSMKGGTWWREPSRWVGGRVCLSRQPPDTTGNKKAISPVWALWGCPQPCAGDEMLQVDWKRHFSAGLTFADETCTWQRRHLLL